jgi:hypothetical protein
MKGEQRGKAWRQPVAYKASDERRRKGEGGGGFWRRPHGGRSGERGSCWHAWRRGTLAGDQDPPTIGTGGAAAPGMRQGRGGDTDMWAPRSQCRVLNQPSQSIQTCSNSLYTQASTMINSTTEVYIWIVRPTAENI